MVKAKQTLLWTSLKLALKTYLYLSHNNVIVLNPDPNVEIYMNSVLNVSVLGHKCIDLEPNPKFPFKRKTDSLPSLFEIGEFWHFNLITMKKIFV